MRPGAEVIQREAAAPVSLRCGDRQDLLGGGREVAMGVEALLRVKLTGDVREERERGDQLRRVDRRAHDGIESPSSPRLIRDFIGDWFGTPLGRWTAIARFYQFLADLLEAELTPASALRLAGFAAGSPRLKRAASRMANEISAGGGGLPLPYQRTRTATALYALYSDLPLAARVRLLREVSSGHAERGRVVLSWTRGVVEPISILLIGLMVGWVVVGLFLPMLFLVQGLS